MGGYALLICRSQTEAIGLRRHLARLGVPGEVARPPRHERTESCGWAVRVSAQQADWACLLYTSHQQHRHRHFGGGSAACVRPLLQDRPFALDG